MFKKIFYTAFLISAAFISVHAQNSDTVMVLPFENTSNKPEFNWVGESFADALSGLLKVPSLNVISNQERKIIQQRLKVPLTVLPSLATSLKLAREAKTSLLVAGRYSIIPAQGDVAATVSVTAKIIRVNEGRFLSEDFPDGKRRIDIVISDALQKGKELSEFEKYHNRLVSKFRQPIESLFNWIIEKTNIQRASKVRSTNALLIHCWGKLAFAFFLLVFYY